MQHCTEITVQRKVNKGFNVAVTASSLHYFQTGISSPKCLPFFRPPAERIRGDRRNLRSHHSSLGYLLGSGSAPKAETIHRCHLVLEMVVKALRQLGQTKMEKAGLDRHFVESVDLYRKQKGSETAAVVGVGEQDKMLRLGRWPS